MAQQEHEEVEQQNEVEQDDQAQAYAEQNEQAEDAPADDGEVVISIEGVTPPAEEEEAQQAPQWVRDLRKTSRDQAKLIRELQAEKAERERQAQPGAVKVGEKPTLESCDYDADRFETELTSWHERKRTADSEAEAQRKQQENAQAAWNERLASYGTAKAALKVADFDDAEAVVLNTLSPAQQSIIVHGADKHAELVYALGKSPAKAKELAAITDPVRFAFAVAKLETQLKVTPRKPAPAPERQIGGSGGQTSMDNELEKLRKEADRTGDRSKVIRYMRDKQRAA